MKIFAIEGAALVPIEMPKVCWYILPLNWKAFFVNTWCNRVIRWLVGMFLLVSLSKACRIVLVASLCGMLVYSEVTSRVTNMACSGSGCVT